MDWNTLADTLKTRSKDDCRNLWLIKQIFIIYNIFLGIIKFIILYLIKLYNFKNLMTTSLLKSNYSYFNNLKRFRVFEQGVDHDNEIDFEKINNDHSAQENEARWKQVRLIL